MTLVNFMPLDRSHPVALELLRLNLGRPRSAWQQRTCACLCPPLPRTFVNRASRGKLCHGGRLLWLCYANDTAAARVLVGEKPLPSAVSGTTAGVDPLVSGEAWLCGSERKVVYVGDARVESAAQTTVAELLGAAGVGADDVKAVTWAIPCVPLWCPRTLAMPSPYLRRGTRDWRGRLCR